MSNANLGFQLAQQGTSLTSSSQDNALNAASSNLSGAGALAPPKSPSGSRKTSTQVLRYPQAKLTTLDDYFEIKIIRYQRQKIQTGASNFKVIDATTQIRTSRKKEIIKTILLPMPKEVPTDTNQVGWGDDRMNSLEAYGAEALTRVIQSRVLPSAAIAEIQNAIKKAEGAVVSGNAQSVVQSAIVTKLLQSFGSNITNEGLLSRATGQILNPNLELLFNNVALRSFPFSFDLAPRDASESQVIKDIIRTFKQAMAAKTRAESNAPGVGLFLSAPDIFEISYKSGGKDHPFLNRFKPCALTSMSVNYAAAGAYATYPDATPVHMIMQLNFTELNPIYHENYNEAEGQIGVGY
jgi:hypothetical protein